MRVFWGMFAALALLTGCASAPDVTLPTAPTQQQTTTTPAAEVARGLPPSEPTEVRIPKIGAKSSLVPLGLNPDETIEVPPVEQPMQAGWYKLARTPGEPGPAVLLGHVDGNKQPGIFFRLKELAEGDEVEVSRKDGTTAKFRVRRTEQIAKNSFPTEAVYGETDEPELRLITCGGSYDQSARSYRDNIIVYATLI
ncbi:LPXTG-site transpeptidase (sortase) family protein [Lentzea atacamensis]|uniref:LPXTG-site transpeptidase (Sortase) family protein n=1 Tax=Lentzea atacamensis TaxID=531938 RepID=A0A316HVY2_9PSEU|nr:class F sortase [Lentzea atacamensis]PWK84102.1 LPXTG-site transpeptidase (sortase) family protein [Lentzea atacamensis]